MADQILRNELSQIGVDEQNRDANWFEYSTTTLLALDLAASAAGRLDAEAARLLRMAYGMMKFRVDKLLEMSLFGPVEGAKKFGMAPRPIKLHSFFITSSAAMAAMQGENAGSLLDGIDIAMSDTGDPMKMEGDLMYGLAVIIRSERMINKADPSALVTTISDEEKEIVAMLQIAAATILDLIMDALQILKNKILELQALYVCLSCGYQGTAPDEEYKCPLCGGTRSSVCYKPFKPGKETVDYYADLIRS